MCRRFHSEDAARRSTVRTTLQELQRFLQQAMKLVRWLQMRWKRFPTMALSLSRRRKTMKTELDLVEGMQFDRGYIYCIHGY